MGAVNGPVAAKNIGSFVSHFLQHRSQKRGGPSFETGVAKNGRRRRNPMEQIEKFTTNLNILCRSHLFKSRSLRVIQRLLHALNVFSSCPKPLYKMCNVASLIYQYYFKDNSLRKKTHKKQIQIIFGDCTTSFSIKISDKNSQFS